MKKAFWTLIAIAIFLGVIFWLNNWIPGFSLGEKLGKGVVSVADGWGILKVLWPVFFLPFAAFAFIGYIVGFFAGDSLARFDAKSLRKKAAEAEERAKSAEKRATEQAQISVKNAIENAEIRERNAFQQHQEAIQAKNEAEEAIKKAAIDVKKANDAKTKAMAYNERKERREREEN